jgi:DNA-binding NarL/FixJ family response regulator
VTGPEPPVRVLVVDDQQLIRDGIASLLALQPGVDVVGTAADGRAAVDAALALAPDVVLMDVRMPELDGVDSTAVLRREAPGCRVIMLTTFDDEDYVVRALTAGATGYLLKDLPAGELAAAIRLACAGVAPIDPSVAQRLAGTAAAPDRHQSTCDNAADPGSPLTAREREVLRLVATGSTNREIAARLYLSEGTVKNHISRILGRLGLRDRTQAAVYARDNQLI